MSIIEQGKPEKQVRLFVIFTGEAISLDVLASRLKSAVPGFKQDGERIAIDVEGQELAVYGVGLSPGVVDSFWFCLTEQTEAHLQVFTAIQSVLGWTTQLRWGFRHSEVLLPPSLDEMKQARGRVEGRVGWILPILDVVVPLLAVRAISTTPRTEAWERLLAWGLSALVICGAAILLLEGLSRITLKQRVRDAIRACPLIVLIWYTAGGPANWIWTMSVVLFLGAVSSFHFVRKSRETESAKRGADLAHAWMLAKLDEATDWKFGPCLACDYDLRKLASCRCPECGHANYHLVDRPDAKELALQHGAVF